MTRRRFRAGDPFEDLLDGRPSDDSALFELLTAARAPGTRHDMLGLPAAREAFLDVRRQRRGSTRRLPAATRTAARRLVTLKAMAAVSGATMIGGVAYAASEANLLVGGPEKHDRSTSTPVPQGSPGSRSGGATAGVPGGNGGQQSGDGSGRNSVTSTDLHSPTGLGLPGGENPPGQESHPAQSNQPTHAHPTHPNRPPHPSHPAHPAHSTKPNTGNSGSAERSPHPEPTSSGAARP
jgi:hypothetical protein